MKTLKLAALLLSSVFALSLVTWSVIDGVARTRSAAAMADAANKFLASLTPEQKAKASFGFGDEQRFDWHFIPRERKGVPLKDLDENQRKLAMEFMKTGLGAPGYQKATRIITFKRGLAKWKGPSRGSPRDRQLNNSSSSEPPRPKAPWDGPAEGIHIASIFTLPNGE